MTYRLCAVLFLLCACVQFNDPDPIAWTSVYLTAAITLEMAARGIIYPKISCAIGFSCIVGAILFLPDSFGGFWGDMATNKNIEYARESAGLLLVALCQGWLFYKGVSKNVLKTTPQPQIESIQRADGNSISSGCKSVSSSNCEPLSPRDNNTSL